MTSSRSKISQAVRTRWFNVLRSSASKATRKRKSNVLRKKNTVSSKKPFNYIRTKRDRINHAFYIQPLSVSGRAKLVFSSSAKTKSVREFFQMDESNSNPFEEFNIRVQSTEIKKTDRYIPVSIHWRGKTLPLLYSKIGSMPWKYSDGKHGEISLFFYYQANPNAKAISIGLRIRCETKENTTAIWDYFHNEQYGNTHSVFVIPM
jgi:hypothetical protein